MYFILYNYAAGDLGALLPTWITFNPGMDK